MVANREFKDGVFTFLFKELARLCRLHNALFRAHLTPDQIVINTLDDVLFYGVRNDLSYLADGELISLIEHQSTPNENMPLRHLLYVARLYEKMLSGKDSYKRKLLTLPTPKFIVLYNGETAWGDDEKTLNLSDAFALAPGEKPALELSVRVLNINRGHNVELLNACRDLGDYAELVATVNEEKQRGGDLTECLTRAVKSCIARGVLRDFLTMHSSEVLNMLTQEWNLEDYATVRAEGRA
jgi:hypothetical protein